MRSVYMVPSPLSMDSHPSGINTVIKAYGKLFPAMGYQFVDSPDSADITITHAGVAKLPADIAMLHGIYFTSDYHATKNEWRANAFVVEAIRNARMVTVPSPWVSETMRRDFKIDPVVLPHGVFTEEWKHGGEYREKSVLWAKNRNYDVCDPTPLIDVALAAPEFTFYTTIAPPGAPDNVVEIGVRPPEELKVFIQQSSMVISTVKETWGILYAEALAAGTPVVTADYGHVPNLVRHGATGYVYKKSSVADAVLGIRWVEKHRACLSANASALAGELDWKLAAKKIKRTLDLAFRMKKDGREI